jgi:hypothetical protein
MQRLGLCRAGFSLSTRSRRPQSAKTLLWHSLSDSLAMSPLAHHYAATSLPKTLRSLRHPLGILNLLISQPTPPVRAAKDIVVFRSGPLRSAPQQNPKDFGCAFGNQTAPPMLPLRAVVSRGHIAGNLLNAGFLLGRPYKDLAFAASAFPHRHGAPFATRQDCVQTDSGCLTTHFHDPCLGAVPSYGNADLMA